MRILYSMQYFIVVQIPPFNSHLKMPCISLHDQKQFCSLSFVKVPALRHRFYTSQCPSRSFLFDRRERRKKKKRKEIICLRFTQTHTRQFEARGTGQMCMIQIQIQIINNVYTTLHMHRTYSYVMFNMQTVPSSQDDAINNFPFY